MRSIIAFSCATLMLACGPADESGADAGPAVDAGTALNEMPIVADLQQGEWTEIDPGGDTICSRGQPWAFFFRPGSVNKLVVEFQGGGACWNYTTCSIADAIFKDNIDDVREAVRGGIRQGIYDHENPDNPFAGWNHLFIPYCTGDIHWGRATVEYTDERNGGPPLMLNHRGAVNAEVALRWVKENVPTPETIFLGGCSAGSYGSVGWAPHVMRDFPDARVVQVGDCGAGIITDSFLNDSFPIWNALSTLPGWIEGLDPATIDISATNLSDIYIGVANYYGNQTVGQYNTLRDENQTFYYDAMGGEGGADAWSTKMRDSLYTIDQNAENFRYYIAPGEQHCILPRENFYEAESNGVRLTDWLRDLVADDAPSVACEGCEPEPLP